MNSQFLAVFKILVSGLIIWLVSEVSKRSGKLGGLILSLPITSLIAISWLWYETRDPAKIEALSSETLIFILPSLVFFVVLSFLIRHSQSFYLAFTLAIAVTLLAYALFFKLRGV